MQPIFCFGVRILLSYLHFFACFMCGEILAGVILTG